MLACTDMERPKEWDDHRVWVDRRAWVDRRVWVLRRRGASTSRSEQATTATVRIDRLPSACLLPSRPPAPLSITITVHVARALA